MIITFKQFKQLKFPLFVLPSDDWYITDGVLFVNDRVVDEKKMPGKTLGVRRIQCGRKDLLPLNKAILGIPDLIQAKTKTFIDRAGNPFIYTKTYNSRLRCHKIKRVERKEVASLLWLEGIPAPVTVPRPPMEDFPFVRMLHFNGNPWLIYDYVRRPEKDTYRRV